LCESDRVYLTAGSQTSGAVTVSAKSEGPILNLPIHAGASMLSGKAAADSEVVVFVNDVPIRTTWSNAAGEWVLVGLGAKALCESDRVYVSAGSQTSGAVTVSAKSGILSVNSPIQPGAASISGKAAADSEVVVYVNGVRFGSTRSDLSGNWVLRLQTCGVDALCTDTDGSYTCACSVGYSGDGLTCADVDECAVDKDNCDPHARCTNSKGSFSCACNIGYSGSGVSCVDVNECADGTDSCSDDAACTNNPGSYTCSCNVGFSGTGTVCLDVNECEIGRTDCHAHSSCKNTVGSFTATAKWVQKDPEPPVSTLINLPVDPTTATQFPLAKILMDRSLAIVQLVMQGMVSRALM
jgi:hypothetical protein